MERYIFVGHKQRVQLHGKNLKPKLQAILFDGFRKDNKGNEDPFIWSSHFLYTFCHANIAISKRNLAKIDNPDNDVYYIFIAKYKDCYAIDTVIKAESYITWPVGCYKRKYEELLTANFGKIEANNIIEHHFPKIIGNKLTQHNVKHLVTIVGDKDNSFIPVTKTVTGEYEPFVFPAKYNSKILSLLKVKDNKAYYPVDDETPRVIKSCCKKKDLETLKAFVANNVLNLDDNCKIISNELVKYGNCLRDKI